MLVQYRQWLNLLRSDRHSFPLVRKCGHGRMKASSGERLPLPANPSGCGMDEQLRRDRANPALQID
ncbi:MAG: hypothetical protein AAGL17_12205 [Cyanobacteria bacterium J06576_12]